MAYIWLMPSFCLRIVLFLFIPLATHSQSSGAPRVVSPSAHKGIRFTENKGQWDRAILYKAMLDGGALFVERDGLRFNFYDKSSLRDRHLGRQNDNDGKGKALKAHVYRIRLMNANIDPLPQAFQEGSDYENFFLGQDSSKWRSGVRNYRQLLLKEVYPQVDYELLAAESGVKYNFRVAAGGRAENIKLFYEGVTPQLQADGTLRLKLAIGEVLEHKPYAYQLLNGIVKEVPCRYVLNGNELSFKFPKGYDRSVELVIDPTLVFSAQIGVVTDNFGMTATYDLQGNLYSGGMAFDVGYATTPGAYDLSYNNVAGYGRSDVFISKYNSSGTALLYSTYFGGSGTEVVSSMVVDGAGNLCLYGATSSTNFPLSAGAAYTSFAGGSDIGFVSNGAIFCGGTDMYLSKFNNSGSSLLASTYYGGSGNDGINYLSNILFVAISPAANPCNSVVPTTDYDSLQTNYGDQFRGEIQVDAFNNIYVVSSTRSSNIPIVGGFDNSLNGAQDVILAKFNPSLSALIYSSYYGGNHNDCGNGIHITSGAEVYITGGTCSNNLQGTGSGYLSAYQGGKSDGFLCMVNAAGNAIVNATYIGTNQYDNSFFVSADNNGKVFVFGQSFGNMPVQAAPTSTALYSNPGTHQFISAYTRTLNSLYMSTVFGHKLSGVDISPSAFKVDTCNKIVLSGWGGGLITNTVAMSNMPILNPIPNHSTTTGYDFYLMALDTNATALKFGSYFGGNQSAEHVDGGTSRFDPSGIIYQSVCAGCSGADDFPLSPGAWPCPNTPNCLNQNPSLNCNNGVFKINFDLERMSRISSSNQSGCNPLTVTFSNQAGALSSTATYTWNFGNGQSSSVLLNPTVTYTNAGTYTVTLVVYDPNSCISRDSSQIVLQVLPQPALAFSLLSTACTNSLQTQNTSGVPSASVYIWSFGDGSPTVAATAPAHTYTSSGIYNITLSGIGANGCSSSTQQSVAINYFQPGIGPPANICYGRTATLSATGGGGYTWTPATALSNPFAAITLASPTVNTVYSVQVQNTVFGISCAADFTTQVLVRPSPTTAFAFTTNPCGGGVQFFDQSYDNIVSWTWTLTSVATSTNQNPYFFYPLGGTYTVSLVTTNTAGCQSKHDRLVQVGQPANVAVSGGQPVCLGGTVQLSASGGVSYSWSPAAGLDMPLSSNPIANPLSSTDYSVLITTSIVVNGEACKYLLNTFVRVDVLSAVPISALANPPLILKGEQSTLVYTGSPGANVAWYPFNSTTPATGYTVTASPPAPQMYTVIATLGACQREIEVFVDVYSYSCLGSDLFIPNTFTPNGDGANDQLFVRGLKVDEFYFAVYNRWGEKVFETRDRAEGWDGFFKGKAVDAGVFGWYLEAKCPGGEEAFLKGNVTLIR